MASTPRFFLIDGHALAYRTYYALTRAGDASRWTTKSGEPTAGTYGFASVLLRLLEKDAPEYLAVSFDTGRTFRDEAYPAYKATRAKMPEDLAPQLDRIRELVAASAFRSSNAKASRPTTCSAPLPAGRRSRTSP